jgi:hypothetical protein
MGQTLRSQSDEKEMFLPDQPSKVRIKGLTIFLFGNICKVYEFGLAAMKLQYRFFYIKILEQMLNDLIKGKNSYYITIG